MKSILLWAVVGLISVGILPRVAPGQTLPPPPVQAPPQVPSDLKALTPAGQDFLRSLEVLPMDRLVSKDVICDWTMPVDYCLVAYEAAPFGAYGPRAVNFLYATRQQAREIVEHPERIGGGKSCVVNPAWHEHIAWVLLSGANLVTQAAVTTLAGKSVTGFAITMTGVDLSVASFAIPPDGLALKAAAACSGLFIGVVGVLTTGPLSALAMAGWVNLIVSGSSTGLSAVQCATSVKAWLDHRHDITTQCDAAHDDDEKAAAAQLARSRAVVMGKFAEAERIQREEAAKPAPMSALDKITYGLQHPGSAPGMPPTHGGTSPTGSAGGGQGWSYDIPGSGGTPTLYFEYHVPAPVPVVPLPGNGGTPTLSFKPVIP